MARATVLLLGLVLSLAGCTKSEANRARESGEMPGTPEQQAALRRYQEALSSAEACDAGDSCVVHNEACRCFRTVNARAVETLERLKKGVVCIHGRADCSYFPGTASCVSGRCTPEPPSGGDTGSRPLHE